MVEMRCVEECFSTKALTGRSTEGDAEFEIQTPVVPISV